MPAAAAATGAAGVNLPAAGEKDDGDLDQALTEMLVSGGSLNLKLLGASMPHAAGERQCLA